MQNRMSLIVFSGTVDKLMAASILATGAAAMAWKSKYFDDLGIRGIPQGKLHEPMPESAKI